MSGRASSPRDLRHNSDRTSPVSDDESPALLDRDLEEKSLAPLCLSSTRLNGGLHVFGTLKEPVSQETGSFGLNKCSLRLVS
jgi:hypothetical protein